MNPFEVEITKKICKGCNKEFTPMAKDHEYCYNCYCEMKIKQGTYKRCAKCGKIVDNLAPHQKLCWACYEKSCKEKK